jgi:urease accessory protein
MINCGGGVVGGDAMTYDIELGARAKAFLTSQSAEKIYRSDGPDAAIDLHLRLGAGARLDWIPQESILFDQARLRRRVNVEMAEDSRLLLIESLVFGRCAMGESRISGFARDSWRIRRGGKLIFAEEFRLEGDLASALDRPACGAGARACATLLYVALDAENCLEALRAALLSQPGCQAGASAWDGMLTARLTASAPEDLRAALRAAMLFLRDAGAPRVWQ